MTRVSILRPSWVSLLQSLGINTETQQGLNTETPRNHYRNHDESPKEEKSPSKVTTVGAGSLWKTRLIDGFDRAGYAQRSRGVA